jgi:hypothetical protein
MIMELFIFFVLILGGGAVWFILNYILAILFNWYQAYYPVYAAMPVFTFLSASVNYGVLLICMIPATIYLWINTQRPEGATG